MRSSRPVVVPLFAFVAAAALFSASAREASAAPPWTFHVGPRLGYGISYVNLFDDLGQVTRDSRPTRHGISYVDRFGRSRPVYTYSQGFRHDYLGPATRIGAGMVNGLAGRTASHLRVPSYVRHGGHTLTITPINRHR